MNGVVGGDGDNINKKTISISNSDSQPPSGKLSARGEGADSEVSKTPKPLPSPLLARQCRNFFLTKVPYSTVCNALVYYYSKGIFFVITCPIGE